MFGRVHRAAKQLADPEAYGLVHAYDPMLAASVLAAGMGAAAATAAGAIAQDASGRMRSATSEAVDHVLSWATHERERYVRLPHTVLAIVADDHVHVFQWTPAGGAGKQVALWAANSFMATPLHAAGEHQLRLVFGDGTAAVLYVKTGPAHRAGHRVLTAIAALTSGSRLPRVASG